MTLLLAGLTYGRPHSSNMQDEKFLFLQCYAISSPVTDFSALARLLNHASNQKAVYKVGLEKLAVFLEEMSASNNTILHVCCMMAKWMTAIQSFCTPFSMSLQIGTSSQNRDLCEEPDSLHQVDARYECQAHFAVQTKGDEGQCPCKLCFQDSDICTAIHPETANELKSD
uniref:Uncharacterized protein n=1 Tax=Ditylenchus dipsaci TaxID=166011 RepID=A0A915E0W1_9BILA